MKPVELVRATAPVVRALDALGIRFFVSGSLASSARGTPRASIDVDLVAQVRAEHVGPLIEKLHREYYLSEEAIRDAIATRSSFNLIHLETMLKVDIFVPADRPFDRSALDRARLEDLDEIGTLRVPVATAEDVILAKLDWFRRGGETSERQWTDVLGVLRVSAASLEREYLEAQARLLGVSDLLQRALVDAATV